MSFRKNRKFDDGTSSNGRYFWICCKKRDKNGKYEYRLKDGPSGNRIGKDKKHWKEDLLRREETSEEEPDDESVQCSASE